ncbi:hypothetical protein MC885_000180 [Smutsia gigantea]|nr:hypothetical protein MC885_000180 [Smutsia gigantea]
MGRLSQAWSWPGSGEQQARLEAGQFHVYHLSSTPGLSVCRPAVLERPPLSDGDPSAHGLSAFFTFLTKLLTQSITKDLIHSLLVRLPQVQKEAGKSNLEHNQLVYFKKESAAKEKTC